VALGFVDFYILAPIDALLQKRISQDSVSVGARLGNGAFGAVYLGTLNDTRDVVIKKGKSVEGGEDFQRVEAYMNRRMRRSIWTRFITAPYVGDFQEKGVLDQKSTVLVWDYKGKDSLEEWLSRRNFPLCLEEPLLGREQTGDERKRSKRIIKIITKQIFGILKELHASGIVHRDVKPANLVLMGRRFVLIDYGAAADLRTGFNYEPDTRLLDPNYCPPELYIMPEDTPAPPPAPIAAIFSPILWQINRPDLYDVYCAGLILMQLAIPTLRNKSALDQSGQFQRNLAQVDYDVVRWMDEYTTNNMDLSLFDGPTVDLCKRLVCERNALRRGRISAGQALVHPFFLL